MCEHHPTLPPAAAPEPHSALGRRALLGLLGASVVGGLGGCAVPGATAPGPEASSGLSAGPGQPTLSVLTVDGLDSTVPNDLRRPGRRPKRTYVSDFRLPPVQGGMAPVLTRVLTKQPVVFLTIDDGVTKIPRMAQLLDEYDYPASLFLTRNFVQNDPGFFKHFEAQGSLVENHTVSHNVNMSRQLSFGQQLAEIAGMQDYAQQQFGRRPTLFRPPGGDYSNAMRQAVAAAGMKAIVTWEAKANAGRMDYQYGNSLRPGDIVLMHFRPEFAADLAAFREAQLSAGLDVVLLENFLGIA
ncbi:peptidoglycan/xylan/chitin deacetylase (PgdA/CDA1 family) [Arthrobacter sp. TE12231]